MTTEEIVKDIVDDLLESPIIISDETTETLTRSSSNSSISKQTVQNLNQSLASQQVDSQQQKSHSFSSIHSLTNLFSHQNDSNMKLNENGNYLQNISIHLVSSDEDDYERNGEENKLRNRSANMESKETNQEMFQKLIMTNNGIEYEQYECNAAHTMTHSSTNSHDSGEFKKCMTSSTSSSSSSASNCYDELNRNDQHSETNSLKSSSSQTNLPNLIDSNKANCKNSNKNNLLANLGYDHVIENIRECYENIQTNGNRSVITKQQQQQNQQYHHEHQSKESERSFNESDHESNKKKSTYKSQTIENNAVNANSSEYESLKDQLNLFKYELKEKDLDIVQLQKEINELMLENKMLKARIPLFDGNILTHLSEEEKHLLDMNNPYIKELLAFKREKDCAVEELAKAQDTISRLKIENSSKSIDLYDPNSPEILHKKLRSYEKQIQDLEDENEKSINELSKVEKILEKYKHENNDLKCKLNETKIYKEHEEALLMELANLKNEFKKVTQTNGELIEDNQRLIEALNTRPEYPIADVCTVSTQTINLDDSDRYGLWQQFPTNNLNIQSNKYLSAQHLNNSQFKNPLVDSINVKENEHIDEYYQSVHKLSKANHHPLPHHPYPNHHQNGQHSNISSGQRINESKSFKTYPGQSIHESSLSKNDDFLINNFRPFGQSNNQYSNQQTPLHSTSLNINNGGRYAQHAQQSQSTTSKEHSQHHQISQPNRHHHSNNQKTSASTFFDGLNRMYCHGNAYNRHTSVETTLNTANTYRRANGNILADNNINNISFNEKPKLNYSQSLNYGQFNRSNKPHIADIPLYHNYEEEPEFASRQNLNVQLNGFKQQTYSANGVSSSVDSSLLDENEHVKVDDKNQHQYNKASTQRNELNKLKSLKINVMRDLKAAQKLKSSLSNSKKLDADLEMEYGVANKILSNKYDTSYSHTYDRNLFNSKQIDDLNASTSSRLNTSYAGIKRSQTFSASTLPRNFSKYLRQTNNTTASSNDYFNNDEQLTNTNNNLNAHLSFNQSDFSKRNSICNQENDSENEFTKSAVYRSKSADRFVFEKMNNNNIAASANHANHVTSMNSSLSREESMLSKKRPFVPTKADDIRMGDIIKFSRPGGKISKGMVKYIGPLPDRNDVYFGLELDSEEGKHDGIYHDKRYFQSKPNKGVFVSFSKVVMAWG